jgi:hypothetical protein
MLACACLAFLMQIRATDPVRSAEAAEMLLKAKTAAHAQRTQSETQTRTGEFEEKFNALVKAIEAFGKKYNEGKGQLWPQQEAAILRKALLELQKLPELQASREGVKLR